MSWSLLVLSYMRMRQRGIHTSVWSWQKISSKLSVSNVEVISTNFYSQILWKYDVPIVRESLITCLTLIVHWSMIGRSTSQFALRRKLLCRSFSKERKWFYGTFCIVLYFNPPCIASNLITGRHLECFLRWISIST